MRRVLVLVGLLAAILATGVNSEEVEMDMDLMQTIEDTNDSLSSNIALENVDDSIGDAQALNELFVIVEAHFVKKGGAENAVEIAEKSKNLTTDIINLVKAKNFEGASNSATDLSRACRSCHTFYKQE